MLLLPSSEEFVSLELCVFICSIETSRICKVVEGKSDPDIFHDLVPLLGPGMVKSKLRAAEDAPLPG